MLPTQEHTSDTQFVLGILGTDLLLFDYLTALLCLRQILETTTMYLFPHNYHRLEEMGPKFCQQT
jgi:hypothetical protein